MPIFLHFDFEGWYKPGDIFEQKYSLKHFLMSQVGFDHNIVSFANI